MINPTYLFNLILKCNNIYCCYIRVDFSLLSIFQVTHCNFPGNICKQELFSAVFIRSHLFEVFTLFRVPATSFLGKSKCNV